MLLTPFYVVHTALPRCFLATERCATSRRMCSHWYMQTTHSSITGHHRTCLCAANCCGKVRPGFRDTEALLSKPNLLCILFVEHETDQAFAPQHSESSLFLEDATCMKGHNHTGAQQLCSFRHMPAEMFRPLITPIHPFVPCAPYRPNVTVYIFGSTGSLSSSLRQATPLSSTSPSKPDSTEPHASCPLSLSTIFPYFPPVNHFIHPASHSPGVALGGYWCPALSTFGSQVHQSSWGTWSMTPGTWLPQPHHVVLSVRPCQH